jgi:NTP pyrophosphatase (non-canonical NTP hydrolase)
MNTFQEYEAVATNVPLSLRNDRDRIQLPVLGLQEAAGKLDSLLTTAFASGRFTLSPAQTGEVKDRLADVLWSVACLCKGTGIPMQELAAYSAIQLQERLTRLDPDRR